MYSLQQKVYSTDYVGGASTGSHGRSTLSLHILSQIVCFENDAELALENTCKTKRPSATGTGTATTADNAGGKFTAATRSFIAVRNRHNNVVRTMIAKMDFVFFM